MGSCSCVSGKAVEAATTSTEKSPPSGDAGDESSIPDDTRFGTGLSAAFANPTASSEDDPTSIQPAILACGNDFDELDELLEQMNTEHKLECALAVSTKMVELVPNEKWSYYYRSASCRFLNRLEEALSDANECIRLDGNWWGGYYGRGGVYQKMSQFESAIEDFSTAIRLGGSEVTSETYRVRGDCYHELKRFADALGDYDHAIEIEPENWSAFNARGMCLVDLGRSQDALPDYAKAIEIRPEPYIFTNRSHCHLLLGMYQDALTDADEAIRRGEQKAHWTQGMALMHLNRLDDALRAMNEALQSVQETGGDLAWQFYRDRSEVFLRLGQLDLCKEDLNVAIGVCPKHPGLIAARARVCWQLGDLEAAKKDLAQYERMTQRQFGMQELAQSVLEEEDYLIDSSLVTVSSTALGKGAFGVVKLGSFDNGLGELLPVAVKRIFLGDDDEKTQEIFREVRFAKSFDHPNFVKIHGCYIEGTRDVAAIVMEYCGGGSLQQWMRDENRSFSDRIGVLKQLSAALAFMHSKEAIHRDLKPENVLFSETGELKIIDFGFSRRLASLSCNTRGTPCYCAPPSLEENEDPRKRDVYSFGIVSWEVTTGKVAFSRLRERYSGDGQALMMAIFTHRVEPKWWGFEASVPEELRVFLSRCWSFEETVRPLFLEVVEFLEGF